MGRGGGDVPARARERLRQRNFHWSEEKVASVGKGAGDSTIAIDYRVLTP